MLPGGYCGYRQRIKESNPDVPPFQGADSSILYIPKYYNPGSDEQGNTEVILKRNLRAGSGFPVPYMVRHGDYDITPLLDSTWSVYILDARPQRIIPDKYHITGATGVLPPLWEHGYSRGLATNARRNEIAYWAAAW